MIACTGIVVAANYRNTGHKQDQKPCQPTATDTSNFPKAPHVASRLPIQAEDLCRCPAQEMKHNGLSGAIQGM
jgi:hypothetical protein